MTQTHAKALTPWIVALMVPAMIISLFAVAIMLAPGADAHPLPFDWDPLRTAQWVGTCGSNRKNLVASVQAMMLDGGRYAYYGYTNTAEAQFDGAIGTKTKNAIKRYQTVHGLSADGCVGPGTWNSLRYNGHLTSNGGGYYVWSETGSPNHDFDPEFFWDTEVAAGAWRFISVQEDLNPNAGCDPTDDPVYYFFIPEQFSDGNLLCDHTSFSCNGDIGGAGCGP